MSKASNYVHYDKYHTDGSTLAAACLIASDGLKAGLCEMCTTVCWPVAFFSDFVSINLHRRNRKVI